MVITSLLWLLLMLSLTPGAQSATLVVGPFALPEDAPEDIVLTGTIEDDAPSQFLRALRARPSATRLVLSSDGGKVDPALIVASEVHRRGIETRIPSGSGCYSACAYIFFAGKVRSVETGGALGVHQIYGAQDPEAVQTTFSDIFDALRGFGVSDEVISTMLRTPPDGMYVFSVGELADLGIETATQAEVDAAAPTIDPASAPGSQSLLLEASDNGSTGAVPFSGTVRWSQGTDSSGTPTLLGRAHVPARSLSLDFSLRRNTDRSLPASHVMEVNFQVADSFIGGSIAGLPGVLLKKEELVQGAPLAGTSSRVVGNSFVFALSASPADVDINSELLTSNKWMDLALIYSTGKRAILTLELDQTSLAIAAQLTWRSKPENVGVVSKTPQVVAPTRLERVVIVHKAGSIKDLLLKNGFDAQTYDMVSATLKNVLSSANVPGGARLRILLGPARNSQTLIPHRLSIYFPDPKTGEIKHAVTAALTDRGSYVLGLEPPAIEVDGLRLGMTTPEAVSGPDGTQDRYRPAN